MKRNFILLLLFAVSISSLQAQSELSIKINHFLGEEPFSLDLISSNNLNQNYILNRLEYYISEIEIIHDNGTSTSLSGRYLLIDANEPLDIDLGLFNINSIEKINFYVISVRISGC